MNRDLVNERLHEIRDSAGGSKDRDAAKTDSDVELATISEQLTRLNVELGQLRDAVIAAATGSSLQAASLARWTKWYVAATFLLVLITIQHLRR